MWPLVFAYLSMKSSVLFFWMLSACRSSQMISSRANDNAMNTNKAWWERGRGNEDRYEVKQKEAPL